MADDWQIESESPVGGGSQDGWEVTDESPVAERGVLQRAGDAMSGTFQSGLEAGKKLFTPRTEAEKEEGYGVVGALKGLKETGEGLLSPLTMTVGPVMAGGQSLIASGMGALQRGAQRGITAGIEQFSPEKAEELRKKIPSSEEAYKTWEPNVGTAMQALGVRPGFSALTAAESVPKEISRAITRDADTPAALNQRLAEVRTIRPDATVADVGGENVRGIVERVAQTPGAGRTTIVPHLEARQKAQMGRIADDLTGATGTRQTAFRAIEDTMDARKNAATPLYEQAYAEGSEAIWSPELERLSGAPFVKSAMQRAVSGWKNNAIADGYGAMNPSQVDRGGILTFGKSVPVYPDLQFWDYTKQQLDGMTSAALRAGQNQKARTLTRLTQQLRAGLDGHPQVPASYAEARNAWSGPSRYIDAIEDGKSIFNKNITAEEWTHNFNALSEAEKEGTRIGIVGAIRQKMAANPAKMPDLTRELRSEDMRAKMAAIMPTPEAAEKFNRALDYEIKSSELAHRSLAGSQTYRRLMEKVDAENIFGEAALHILAPHHSMRGIFINLFRTLSKPVRDTLRSRMDARSAELLTGTGDLPIPGNTPMRRLPLSIPLAGSATVENPKGFKKGGRVTKTFRYRAGGGPAGPGGETDQVTMVNDPAADAANFPVTYNTPSGGAPDTGFQYSDGSMIPTGGGSGSYTDWAGTTSPAAGDPLGGWFSTGALQDAQRNLAMATSPQVGPASASNPTNAPSASLTPAGQAFLAAKIPSFGFGPGAAQGRGQPSTFNWRLLPPPYNTPNFMMQNGHIINKVAAAKNVPAYGAYEAGLADTSNIGVVFGPGGPGASGYPVSRGSATVRAYYYPGQIEPPIVEGAPGTTARGGRIKGMPSIRR